MTTEIKEEIATSITTPIEPKRKHTNRLGFTATATISTTKYDT